MRQAAFIIVGLIFIVGGVVFCRHMLVKRHVDDITAVCADPTKNPRLKLKVCEACLGKHGRSSHADTVKALAAQARAELPEWDWAQLELTPTNDPETAATRLGQLRQFIADYPTNPHRKEAETWIARYSPILQWSDIQAQLANEPVNVIALLTQVERFIVDFPAAEQIADAHALRDLLNTERDWAAIARGFTTERAVAEKRVVQIQAFLRNHPDSVHHQHAKKLLSADQQLLESYARLDALHAQFKEDVGFALNDYFRWYNKMALTAKARCRFGTDLERDWQEYQNEEAPNADYKELARLKREFLPQRTQWAKRKQDMCIREQISVALTKAGRNNQTIFIAEQLYRKIQPLETALKGTPTMHLVNGEWMSKSEYRQNEYDELDEAEKRGKSESISTEEAVRRREIFARRAQEAEERERRIQKRHDEFFSD